MSLIAASRLACRLGFTSQLDTSGTCGAAGTDEVSIQACWIGLPDSPQTSYVHSTSDKFTCVLHHLLPCKVFAAHAALLERAAAKRLCNACMFCA